LENLSDSKDINRAWESTKEKIETSAQESLGLSELKQHKLWFDEESLGFFIKVNRLKCSGYWTQTKTM
jgi:hypothetical protein